METYKSYTKSAVRRDSLPLASTLTSSIIQSKINLPFSLGQSSIPGF